MEQKFKIRKYEDESKNLLEIYNSETDETKMILDENKTDEEINILLNNFNLIDIKEKELENLRTSLTLQLTDGNYESLIKTEVDSNSLYLEVMEKSRKDIGILINKEVSDILEELLENIKVFLSVDATSNPEVIKLVEILEDYIESKIADLRTIEDLMDLIDNLTEAVYGIKLRDLEIESDFGEYDENLDLYDSLNHYDNYLENLKDNFYFDEEDDDENV